MSNKLIRTGLLLSLCINMLLFICLYALEYRVGLLESVHEYKADKR